MAVNGSFVSPTADAKVAHQIASLDPSGIISTVLNGVNGWTIVLTTILALVAYDQCKFNISRCAGA
jgi:C-22 sterol desaturase